jgi:hypothetical protein
LAKWRHVVLALSDALAGPKRGYVLTRRVGAARNSYAAASVHSLVVAIVTAAWTVGTARGVIHHRVLNTAAAIVIALSLAVALSMLRRFPPPYDDTLAASQLGQPGRREVPALGVRE